MKNLSTEALHQIASESRAASRVIAGQTSEIKNAILLTMADKINNSQATILAANLKDLQSAKENNLSAAMLDRLMLNPDRIQQMIFALKEVAELDDPIGEKTQPLVRPNGIRVQRMRIPLGVILMIYESRPNVTVEASALCLKSGNAVIMRGGSDAYHSNQALAECWQQALSEHNLPQTVVTVLKSTQRQVLETLLTLDQFIDLVIPRGGEGLIRYVVKNSRIPVIQHYKGVCHLYIDKDADLEMGKKLLINGKVSRPGVCNSLETLLVHSEIASEFLTVAAENLSENNVEMRGCEKTIEILSNKMQGVKLATDEDFDAEFLALIIAIKVVDCFDQAIAHIEKYSSDHTEVIVTENNTTANDFIQKVNSSVVMVNASSRFSDGGQLGLGAEIGISTSRLHAYGPMGIQALTTQKFVVCGDGQIR